MIIFHQSSPTVIIVFLFEKEFDGAEEASKGVPLRRLALLVEYYESPRERIKLDAFVLKERVCESPNKYCLGFLLL